LDVVAETLAGFAGIEATVDDKICIRCPPRVVGAFAGGFFITTNPDNPRWRTTRWTVIRAMNWPVKTIQVCEG
jgi:hypothetical protein